jgi:hypothetical protein
MVTTNSSYGDVTAEFAMSGVKCLGKETTLNECPRNPEPNCTTSMAAGVSCT